AFVAVAAPTPCRATARGTRVRIARPATRARSPTLDTRARGRGHVGVARSVRPPSDVVRLVEHACASAWGEAVACLAHGVWPAASVVTHLFGTLASRSRGGSGAGWGSCAEGPSDHVLAIGQ